MDTKPPGGPGTLTEPLLSCDARDWRLVWKGTPTNRCVLVFHVAQGVKLLGRVTLKSFRWSSVHGDPSFQNKHPRADTEGPRNPLCRLIWAWQGYGALASHSLETEQAVGAWPRTQRPQKRGRVQREPFLMVLHSWPGHARPHKGDRLTEVMLLQCPSKQSDSSRCCSAKTHFKAL